MKNFSPFTALLNKFEVGVLWYKLIEDEEYSFYCSNSSIKNSLSLIFTFDKSKQLNNLSVFSKSFIGKELYLSFDFEDIQLEPQYFQRIWEQFKPGFKQYKKTRIRMLAEGFC